MEIGRKQKGTNIIRKAVDGIYGCFKAIDKGRLRMKLRCLSMTFLQSKNTDVDGKEGDRASVLKEITPHISKGIIALLLGLSRLYGGIYPFGLAFFCASSGKSTYVCFASLILSSFFCQDMALIQTITVFLLFLCRKTFTLDKFNEKLKTKVILGLCTSIFLGVVKLFSATDGKDIFAFILYVVLTGCSIYLFSFIFSEDSKIKSNGLYLVCIYTITVCIIPALNRFEVYNIDFGLIFACFATLTASKVQGPVYGCVCGFLTGFACNMPLFSAPLGMAGILSGFLFTTSFGFSALLFPVTASLTAFYLLGFSAVTDFLPFCLFALFLFLIFGGKTPSFLTFAGFNQKSVCISADTVHRKSGLDKISESLSGMSAVLYKFAEHFKAPTQRETEEVIDSCFKKVCQSCSMNSLCYAKSQCDYQKTRSKISSTLHKGILSRKELSEMLLEKCIKSNEISDEINKSYSDLNFLNMKSNRTQTVASLYNSMSHLIKTAQKDMVENNSRDVRLEKKISDALIKIGVEFSTVSVFGIRSKDVYVHSIKANKIPCSADDLSSYLSEVCAIEFNNPTFDLSDSANLVMKLTRSQIISAEYAQCCSSKQQDNVNGDTVCFFETDSGYFYSVICDGMGSGKTAAATSRLSCVFLEKLLSAGTRKNVCLEMLNNLLLSKNDETFSTVDVLEIDKLNSTAHFLKAGAAPSFVLRNSKLYKISSETPPVGIIHSFCAEGTKFSLEKGDVIIMVSDGIIQNGDDDIWLSEMIRLDTCNEPALLASELIEKAAVINSRRDDCSACVIKIC